MNNYILIIGPDNPQVQIIREGKYCSSTSLGYDKSHKCAMQIAQEFKAWADYPIIDAYNGFANAEVRSWGGIICTDPNHPERGMITKCEYDNPDNGGIYKLTYADKQTARVHYSYRLKAIA